MRRRGLLQRVECTQVCDDTGGGDRLGKPMHFDARDRKF
jgi:hypothetical protein